MHLQCNPPACTRRLVLVCGRELSEHISSAASDLARRINECYSRPYLAPSLRDRTLCMLCHALDCAVRAAAVAGAGAAAGSSCQQLQGAGGEMAGAAAGPGAGLFDAPLLLTELTSALSEGAFAENLAAYAVVCCGCFWDVPGSCSSNGGSSVSSGADASPLGPEEWPAIARAELAVKCVGLAAAALAQRAGAAEAGNGCAASSKGAGSSGASRRAKEALARLAEALAAIPTRIASRPLPHAAPAASAAVAATAAVMAAARERRSGALRVVRSAASGLYRIQAACPVTSLQLHMLPSADEVASWIEACVREAAAEDEKAQVLGGVEAGGKVQGGGGQLALLDWGCLEALLSLLLRLSPAAGQRQVAGHMIDIGGAEEGSAAVSGGSRQQREMRYETVLPAALLVALLPAGLEALKRTSREEALVSVLKCLQQLWMVACASPLDVQVGGDKGDSRLRLQVCPPSCCIFLGQDHAFFMR